MVHDLACSPAGATNITNIGPTIQNDGLSLILQLYYLANPNLKPKNEQLPTNLDHRRFILSSLQSPGRIPFTLIYNNSLPDRVPSQGPLDPTWATAPA